MYYKLVDHKVVPVEDVLEWAKVIESEDRIVAKTNIKGIKISTVFLGLDHSFGWIKNENTPPVVFETMVFGGELDGHQKRYRTWDEAEQGHHIICSMVKKALKK